MDRDAFLDALHVGVLIVIPGAAAWLLGQPLIFPSLGPTAFVLVFDRREDCARRVIGGHLIGALCGWAAYETLAHGLTLANVSPALSFQALRIVASGVASIVFTTWGMLALRASHAPACATTLIVSLGVLYGPAKIALIMAAVVAIFLAHRLVVCVRPPKGNERS